MFSDAKLLLVYLTIQLLYDGCIFEAHKNMFCIKVVCQVFALCRQIADGSALGKNLEEDYCFSENDSTDV